MKYIYGPVKSRRLGLSLGVTLTPYKICSFDCIYCQLGRGKQVTQESKEYLPTQEIIGELKSWLQDKGQAPGSLNYITLSGSGEPTLNSNIGELITRIKEITAVPVAVITNASLFGNPLVRNMIVDADLVIPSLDAATPRIFLKINRPHENIMLQGIIDGLASFRQVYRGKMWLEVMLVKGVNDDLRHIKKLKEVIDVIRPDAIQLNSPVRTTAEENILPVEKKKLEKIKEIFGDNCEII
jgi:wyosine [tRNA(Phe)-imidazoG37] synthetase (radical SAM superfamily)